MIARDVEYLEPETLEEALRLLSKHKGAARVLVSGGTDLLVPLKKGKVLPRYVINMQGIPDLNLISYDDSQGLRIGALATIDAVATSPIIRRNFSLLAQAAAALGTPQIRNRATIGGNLCNASPSAEMAPALLVLETRLKMRGADGERIVPLEEFFVGPGKTVLKSDEILTEIQVPDLPPQSAGVYLRQTVRKALDLAIVGVAVLITLQGDTIQDARIALGAVAPVPMRARKAEAVLRSKRLNDALLDEAGLVASGEASPITDIRSSAEYRRKMIQVLVARAIKQAVGLIKQN